MGWAGAGAAGCLLGDVGRSPRRSLHSTISPQAKREIMASLASILQGTLSADTATRRQGAGPQPHLAAALPPPGRGAHPLARCNKTRAPACARAPSRARAPACSHGGAGRRTEAGRLRHRAAAPRRGRRRRPHDAPVGRAAVQELCQAQLEGASGHPARARGRRHARSRARLPAPSPCRPLTCRAARPLAVPPSPRRARRRMTATCRSPRATARRSRPTWCT